jgi:hypothetical protein
MNDDVTLDRRRFLAGMVTALAASELGTIDLAHGQTESAAAAPPRATENGGSGSFDTLKRVEPDEERFFAKRMRATTTELPTSHVPMLSQPAAVAAVLMDAAEKAYDGR